MRRRLSNFSLGLICALSLFGGAAVELGCKSNTNPANTVMTADQVVITGANASRDLFAQWYVTERSKAQASGNTARLALLESYRSTAEKAWNDYVATATAIVITQQAALLNATNSIPVQITATIAAAAQPFINLVAQLLTK